MTTTHRHQPIILGAAQELLRAGVIRTFDAVYRWQCPDCGMAQRTTRLADTMYALRHAYGWEIETVRPNADELAEYKLIKAGDMPGDESKGPHPRRLVGEATLDTAKSIHDYANKGLPIPVEAIPSPTAWRCTNCELQIDKPIGQPQLGGFRRANCPRCGHATRGEDKNGRIFFPVK